MSLNQLQAFLKKVQSDSVLKAKVSAPGADIAAIAKSEGFEISADSLKKLNNPDWLMGGADAEAMEAIAGGAAAASGSTAGTGTTCWTLWCTCMPTCNKSQC